MYIIVCHYLYCKYTTDLSSTSTDLIWMHLVLAKLVQELPRCSNDNHLCLQTQIPTGTATYVDLALECLGNHTQVLSISLTWGAPGNVWWHAMTNFPLPSRSSWESFQSASMFSWQFPDVSSSLSYAQTSANISTAGRAAHACICRVIAARNRGFEEHRRPKSSPTVLESSMALMCPQFSLFMWLFRS